LPTFAVSKLESLDERRTVEHSDAGLSDPHLWAWMLLLGGLVLIPSSDRCVVDDSGYSRDDCSAWTSPDTDAPPAKRPV